jgi:hypothetical protein
MPYLKQHSIPATALQDSFEISLEGAFSRAFVHNKGHYKSRNIAEFGAQASGCLFGGKRLKFGEDPKGFAYLRGVAIPSTEDVLYERG